VITFSTFRTTKHTHTHTILSLLSLQILIFQKWHLQAKPHKSAPVPKRLIISEQQQQQQQKTFVLNCFFWKQNKSKKINYLMSLQ